MSEILMIEGKIKKVNEEIISLKNKIKRKKKELAHLESIKKQAQEEARIFNNEKIITSIEEKIGGKLTDDMLEKIIAQIDSDTNRTEE